MIDPFQRLWVHRAATKTRIAAAGMLICFAPVVLAQSIGSREVTGEVAPIQTKSKALTAPTRLDYRKVPVALEIALPSIDEAPPTIGQDERKPGIPLQIGFPRPVPEANRGDLVAGTTWITLPDSTKVTAITLRSPGAGRLRVALQAVLPEGATVRFFGPGRFDRSSYPVYTHELFARRGADSLDGQPSEPGGLLWSPIVDGDTLGIEIELPAGMNTADTQLRIVRISHMPESAARSSSATGSFVAKADESCPLVDVACKELPSCPKNAVGRISFTKSDGKSYWCTGTVVNTPRPEIDNTLDPYFLTAHHCISTQGVADSMEIDFFYEYETCDGSDLSFEHTTLYLGGELLVTDPSTDMSLLELRSSLADGTCLSGWNVNVAGLQESDSDVISMTHPDGLPKKYSAGNPVAYGFGRVDDFVVDIVRVDWSEGLTLGGSSGGGLFALDDDGDRTLIGALSGGRTDEACPSEGALFGRFDLFYVNEAQRYLRPDDPVNDDHGGAFASATGILRGSETAGQIDHRADADMFRIVVTEPGILILSTTGGTNTVGRLIREDGTVIYADAEGGYFKNFRIAAYVEEGTYYVRVSGYDPEAVGHYRLHATFTAASERPAAQIPLFLSTSDPSREGFIRMFNASNAAGTVEITAFDDEGSRYGPLTLSIDAQQTRHFNSGDLENGNTAKGLTGNTGAGSGDWRLRFDTELPIEVAAYIRTPDGFLTVMHDAAYVYRSVGQHFISIFNPGSNKERLSKLRLINPVTTREVRAAIFGQDDAGNRGAGTIELTLPPGGSRTVDAVQMEAGGTGFTGSLGDGEGKWRLWVEAEGDIVVLNLLDSDSGHLANLSSPGHITE